MLGSELRTYCFSAVLCLLLGAGIGVGWHYFVDTAGVRAVASAATSAAPQDAPDPPSSHLSATAEHPARDVHQSSDGQQPARSSALDLSDEERLALVALLTGTIVHDRYPQSPRVRTLKDVLAKLEAKPLVQPSPAPNLHMAPGAKRAGVRRE
jgi:hypothetical protein